MAPIVTSLASIVKQFGIGGLVAGVGGGTGLTATGGVISDYSDGPAVYRAHVFTSSGTFSVTAGSNNVEYLVVAGGGSGGSYTGGTGSYEVGGGGLPWERGILLRLHRYQLRPCSFIYYKHYS